MHKTKKLFGRHLTNLAKLVLIKFRFFACESRVEKSFFLKARYMILSLVYFSFCELKSFCTTKNILGKHLTHPFNKKNPMKTY